jgi:phage nucleotide-binding protein
MAITITTLDEAISDDDPKIILYGDAGTGKTTLAGTLPGKVLILSAEKGLRSLKRFSASDRKRVSVAEVESSADLRDAYDRLVDGRIAVDWVVLDSISELAEMILREYKRRDKDPRQSYGKVDDDITDILRSFRDLSCGVLLLAKEHVIKRQIGEQEIDYHGLLMPGQRLTTNAPHLVDNVWRLVVKGGRRMVITQADGRSRAKSRDGLDPVEDVTDGLGDIVAKMREAPDSDESPPPDFLASAAAENGGGVVPSHAAKNGGQ